MLKRQRGRPPKVGDTIEWWRFVRAAMALCAYDEARRSGQKHSAAVADAMHFVKQLYPDMPISETEVRRTLAAWWPRGSRIVLCFERSSLSEEAVKINRWIREQLAALQGKKGLILPEPPNYDLPRSVAVYKIRFAERPNYPRHNRRNPEE